LQALAIAVDKRNSFVHPIADADSVSLAPLEQVQAAMARAREAREICGVVRDSLLLLAKLLEREPPQYLEISRVGAG